MSTHPLQTTQVLIILQRCHTLLNHGWRKPGALEPPFSHLFIGTKPFKLVEDYMNQISEAQAIGTAAFGPVADECKAAIRCACEAIKWLNKTGRQNPMPEIDAVFNLLYLGTGVLWHCLASSINEPVVLDDTASPVEDYSLLLSKCMAKQMGGPGIVLKLLVIDLNALICNHPSE
ncbi:MAG: hypothetical protein WCO56_06700 [Verrucomicrobiota bacterium]